MEGCPLKKSKRRAALVNYVADNPFATDEQLAANFGVSVATIRLDRTTLHIPEVRERTRQVAASQQDAMRALQQSEVMGDVVELKLNRSASSILQVDAVHVFARTGIVRGHILFAQVNSLATAVIDAQMALTAKSELRYYRPVHLGETVWARADIVGGRFGVKKCRVSSQVGTETVLEGWIWVVKAHLDTRLTAGGTIDEIGD